MTQIHDMFNEGFRSHADAVARSGGLGSDFERGAVKSIRRRRTTRAVGTGAGSALAIGAVGVAVWAVPGVRGGTVAPAAPMTSAERCEAELFVPPSPGALGDAPFAFRAYVQVENGVPSRVVVVHLNGSVRDIEPQPNGDWIYSYDGRDYPLVSATDEFDTPSTGLVTDWDTDGTGGGRAWDGRSPVNSTYAWTTQVPDAVPNGVNTAALSGLLLSATGLNSDSFDPHSVPKGAVVEAIVVDGTGERSTVLRLGDAMPILAGIADDGSRETPAAGLESISLRVSGLPDGQTFSIVSTFDANNIPAPTCLLTDVDPALLPN